MGIVLRFSIRTLIELAEQLPWAVLHSAPPPVGRKSRGRDGDDQKACADGRRVRSPRVVIRDGRRQTLTVQVGQRPTEEELARQAGGGTPDQEQALGEEGPVSPGTALGLSLQPLNPQIIRALNLPADVRGVVITSVDPNSDAAEKTIRRGDVILSVNRQPVTTPAQVLAAVEAARRAGRSSVLLLIKRGQAPEAFVGVDIGTR